jgi:hypothetical protein
MSVAFYFNYIWRYLHKIHWLVKMYINVICILINIFTDYSKCMGSINKGD